jgi:hypothetical protein
LQPKVKTDLTKAMKLKAANPNRGKSPGGGRVSAAEGKKMRDKYLDDRRRSMMGGGGKLKGLQDFVQGAAAVAPVGRLAAPVAGRIAARVAAKNAIRSGFGRRVGDATYNKATKGLSKASSGGKVSRTQTPMGPTLRSTRIQSEAERAARIGNLEKRASNIARSAEKQAIRVAAAKAAKEARRRTVVGGALAGGEANRRRRNRSK